MLSGSLLLMFCLVMTLFCGLVHPIMLNNLLHGRLGFAWGVRISALFNLVLLIIANLLMTT